MAEALVLLDTSVAIPFLLDDHEWHGAALASVQGNRLGLAGHAWFETYSVLTRLRSGLRRSPADVHRLLAHNFPETRFLGSKEAARVGDELARIGISGGAVYDAIVAAVARQHGLPLLSADRRAMPTYERLGVHAQLLT